MKLNVKMINKIDTYELVLEYIGYRTGQTIRDDAEMGNALVKWDKDGYNLYMADTDITNEDDKRAAQLRFTIDLIEKLKEEYEYTPTLRYGFSRYMELKEPTYSLEDVAEVFKVSVKAVRRYLKKLDIEKMCDNKFGKWEFTHTEFAHLTDLIIHMKEKNQKKQEDDNIHIDVDIKHQLADLGIIQSDISQSIETSEDDQDNIETSEENKYNL